MYGRPKYATTHDANATGKHEAQDDRSKHRPSAMCFRGARTECRPEAIKYSPRKLKVHCGIGSAPRGGLCFLHAKKCISRAVARLVPVSRRGRHVARIDRHALGEPSPIRGSRRLLGRGGGETGRSGRSGERPQHRLLGCAFCPAQAARRGVARRRAPQSVGRHPGRQLLRRTAQRRARRIAGIRRRPPRHLARGQG